MINEIHIQNFRCFEDTWVSDFRNINLIGGLNNSGKTALLEALFLASFPEFATIEQLALMRRQKPLRRIFSSNREEQTVQFFLYSRLDFLFLNLLREKKINISTIFDSSKTPQEFKLHFLSEEEILAEPELAKNSINLDAPILQFQNFKRTIRIRENSLYRNSGLDFPNVASNFFHTNIRLESKDLAKYHSDLLIKNQEDMFNTVLQIFEPQIKSLWVSNSFDEPIIFAKNKDEKKPMIPLSLFGDAFCKIVEIFLVLFSRNSKVVFIDEIENGIHFTKHKEFWEKLFEISAELGIQIFATTHSLEMIQAFAEAGKEKYEDKAMYFQMRTMANTPQKIIVSSSGVEKLSRAFTNGLPFRGEPL